MKKEEKKERWGNVVTAANALDATKLSAALAVYREHEYKTTIQYTFEAFKPTLCGNSMALAFELMKHQPSGPKLGPVVQLLVEDWQRHGAVELKQHGGADYTRFYENLATQIDEVIKTGKEKRVKAAVSVIPRDKNNLNWMEGQVKLVVSALSLPDRRAKAACLLALKDAKLGPVAIVQGVNKTALSTFPPMLDGEMLDAALTLIGPRAHTDWDAAQRMLAAEIIEKWPAKSLLSKLPKEHLLKAWENDPSARQNRLIAHIRATPSGNARIADDSEYAAAWEDRRQGIVWVYSLLRKLTAPSMRAKELKADNLTVLQETVPGLPKRIANVAAHPADAQKRDALLEELELYNAMGALGDLPTLVGRGNPGFRDRFTFLKTLREELIPRITEPHAETRALQMTCWAEYARESTMNRPDSATAEYIGKA